MESGPVFVNEIASFDMISNSYAKPYGSFYSKHSANMNIIGSPTVQIMIYNCAVCFNTLVFCNGFFGIVDCDGDFWTGNCPYFSSVPQFGLAHMARDPYCHGIGLVGVSQKTACRSGCMGG